MSHTAISLRIATPADISAILPLIASAYRGEESRKGWTTEADLLTGARIDEADLLAKITEPNGVVLLATDASNILVACCELQKGEDGGGYFGLFAVSPVRQGGGLGKQILQGAEDYARKTMGVRLLKMYVIWTRTELIAWYMRRGYTKTAEKKPFPYELHSALRDDLYFEILIKNLCTT